MDNGFFDWIKYWADQIITLVESMKEWYNTFFAA